MNRLFGTRYTDLCYGYNAFWPKHLSTLDLDCDGFEIETVMNVRAAKAGLAIQEIPSYEHLRTARHEQPEGRTRRTSHREVHRTGRAPGRGQSHQAIRTAPAAVPESATLTAPPLVTAESAEIS